MSALTPALIMSLRASVRWHVSVTPSPGQAHIIYTPADDAFLLHCEGHVWAQSADLSVLAECLRQERAEPGFIRRILSAEEPCDVASLDPRARAAHASARAAEAHHARIYNESQSAERERRASHLNLAKLSLDDL